MCHDLLAKSLQFQETWRIISVTPASTASSPRLWKQWDYNITESPPVLQTAMTKTCLQTLKPRLCFSTFLLHTPSFGRLVCSISFIWFYFCQYYLFQHEEWLADLCCFFPVLLFEVHIVYLSSWQTAHPSVPWMCFTVRLDGSLMKEPTIMTRPQDFFFFSNIDMNALSFLFISAFVCTSPICCFDAELLALQFTFFSITWFSDVSIISHCFTS